MGRMATKGMLLPGTVIFDFHRVGTTCQLRYIDIAAPIPDSYLETCDTNSIIARNVSMLLHQKKHKMHLCLQM